MGNTWATPRRIIVAAAAGTVAAGMTFAGAPTASAATNTPIAGPAALSGYSHSRYVNLTTGPALTTVLWLDTNRDRTPDLATYCIENGVTIHEGVNQRGGYFLYDWAGYRSSAPSWSTNRGKVAWILAHSAPTLSVRRVLTAAGVSTGTDDDVTSATQAAIWHFTDGVQLASTKNTVAQKAVYTYLVSNATAVPGTPTGAVSFDTTSASGTAGSLIGPVTLKSQSPATVNVSLPTGFSLVAADRTSVIRPGTSLPAGSRLYLRVPADAPAGSLDVTASVRTEGVPAGMVWDSPYIRTQALITARSTTLDQLAGTSFTWSAARPAETPAPTATPTAQPTPPTPTSPTPTTPEPAPTTPDATSTTPEPAPTTPDATSTTPEPAPTTPDATPTTPEPAPTTPEPTNTTPEPEPTNVGPAPSTVEPAPDWAPIETAPEPTATPAPVATPEPAPAPAPVVTPAPVDTPTPVATPTPTPAPVGQRPTMVTRTFQVDRYVPATSRLARTVAALDDDGVLRYREDRALWGASRWQS